MTTPKPISLIMRLASVIIALSLFAFVIPKDDDPLDKLIAALQKWTTVHPQEKVYLHTDKPYYALGDTIWFKGYITTGSRHQLSAISGSVYVDLINEQDSLVRSLKLPAASGTVMGDFVLGDELKEGNYRLRAYTQWMRNAGEGYFFDKTFTVGSVFSNNIITKADYQYKDIDGKQVLTAILNYTDDQGTPLANKNVQYRIMVNKAQELVKTIKTDAAGNALLNILNEKQTDLTGAYIRTVISNSAGKDVIKDFPIKANLAQSDVQFFPEGGNLINGVVSRIGFKAVGVDGLGINISGKVVDDENLEITSISTLHAGMGSFVLRPEAGKTYTAKIAFADGSTKSIGLPKANNDGYTLSVYQPAKDSILLRISTKTPSQPINLNLIAQTGGEIITAQPVKIERSMTSFWLDRRAFPTGIVQFTIFDQNNQPLNERIAFIRSNDQLQLNLKANKTSFKSKEPVFFTMDAADSEGKPTIGNYSVSVIDESKIPSDEADASTIFSNLLLTSDIKGYVEKPNYYFNNVTDDVNRALDNLMLTQGYRRFTWKELSAANSTAPKYTAEGLGVSISGRVQTLGHKPLPNANVMLMALKAGVTRLTTADSSGRFKFENFFLTDSIKLTIQARTSKNSDKSILILDSVPGVKISKNPHTGDITTNINGVLKAYIDAGKKQDELYEKMGRMDQVHRLRQVNIKAAKDKKDATAMQGLLRIPDGSANRTFTPKEDESTTVGTFLMSHLGAGVIFRDYTPSRNPPNLPYDPDPYEPPIINCPMVRADTGYRALSVILDGRLLRESELSGVFDNGMVDINDIKKIDFVYRNPALTGMLGTGIGAILIYTKTPGSRKLYNPSVVNITPKGFNKARDFYSPKYDRPGSNKQLPDMRSTIYWNPYLKTDDAGKGAFSFFNADGPGAYKVVVEGINADGQLGRQIFRYQVDGDLEASAVGLQAPDKDAQIKLITTSLDNFNQRLPVEKVYLHTDKPYYNMGDTVWFKAYLTDVNNRASKQSKLLYVELNDDSTEAVRRISIPIKNGIGSGQIALPRAIFHEGGYTLRAYTNWMQNFGPDIFFTQRFYLGVPAETAWLVKSTAGISRVADKDELDVDIRLNKIDKKPVALTNVEVKVYEGKYYLFREEMKTGVDGGLKFSKALKDKIDGRNIRVQVSALDKADAGKVVQVPLNINRLQKLDVQFLPEGGYLVAGLKSTIGFKAIGEDGKGMDVSGAIYDSKGLRIADFASLRYGMGSFDFTPKAGESYTAKISSPAVPDKVFDLPKARPVGTVMHIDNAEQSDDVSITISGLEKLSADTACYLVATNGGRLYYSQKLDGKQNTLTVSKSLLPTGIARLSLLRGKQPLNQRMVYIDHKDQALIKVSTNKTAYTKRDSVAMEIEIKDKSGFPVAGNFSIAVTDNSQVKPDSLGNYSIATGLLFKSDLRGNIEAPGYYINRKDKRAWQALDNLLLTQGWTGYDWKDVFNPKKESAFAAEKDFKITGKVTDAFKKPKANASVLLSSQKPSFVLTAIADDQGNFNFNKLPKIDSGSFFLQARNAKGSKMMFGRVEVNRFRPAPVPETFRDQQLPWYVNSDTSQINYVRRVAQKENDANFKGAGTMLRNVNIKTKKIIPGSENRNGAGNSDIAFDEKEIKESGVMNLYQLLRQKLPGIAVVSESNMPTIRLGGRMVVIMVDGVSLQMQLDPGPTVQNLIDELSTYQIQTFKGLEVMTSDKYLVETYTYPPTRSLLMHFKGEEIQESIRVLLQRDPPPDTIIKGPFFKNSRPAMNRPGYLEERANVLTNRPPEFAVIEITTTSRAGWFKNQDPSAVTYRPLPVMYPQQFYSPKYKLNTPAIGAPDYRATIFWEPDVTTDANGKARVKFYTSDLPKDYTVNIQGLGTDGNIGSLIIKMPGAGTKGGTTP